MLTVSMATRASNDTCSDAMTLGIGDWLFYLKGGTRVIIVIIIFTLNKVNFN